MRELQRMIGEFVGASILNIPLTGLLTWGLFLAFSRTSMSRVSATVLSCVLVAAGLLFLTALSEPLDQNNAFQTIGVGIWLVIGLLFWGKNKKPQTPDQQKS